MEQINTPGATSANFQNLKGLSAEDIARELQKRGVPINEAAAYMQREFPGQVLKVANAIQSAYNVGTAAVVNALKTAGYSVQDAANWMINGAKLGAEETARFAKDVYGATANVVAEVYRNLGIGVDAVARTLSTVFNAAPGVVNDILKGVGYAANEIKKAFESIGGAFADFAKSVWDKLDPRKW